MDLSRSEALQFAEDYFATKHTTLWSRAFDIINHTTREEAKEYLVDLLVDLEFFRLYPDEIIEDPLIGAREIE